MSVALFTYPPNALFGRIIPKSKIYEHAAPNAALKALFVLQVEQMVWQYKLATETINLPTVAAVPEIQIFNISLKTPELDEAVLRCIDQAIPLPIFFQLTYGEKIQIKAAYKRPSETDSSRWVTDCYFATEWQAIDSERQPLPLALDLGALYELMLRPLLPIPPRAGETIKLHMERLTQIRVKQSEYRKIAASLHKERQFNRKVALNSQLKTLQIALDKLQHSE
ncbi:MAG: DUF4391 domain-containing protein [Methylococcales bacterium]